MTGQKNKKIIPELIANAVRRPMRLNVWDVRLFQILVTGPQKRQAPRMGAFLIGEMVCRYILSMIRVNLETLRALEIKRPKNRIAVFVIRAMWPYIVQ